MLKKISVDDACVGMFIDEICGSWMDHPFWKSSFPIVSAKQLEKLQNCGIYEIWIDTGKGRDVEPDTPIVTEEEEDAQVNEVLQGTEEEVFTPRELPVLVALHEEVERARKVHNKAKAAVMYMLHDVRMGKALQPEETYGLVDDITQTLVRNSNAFLNLTRFKEADNHTYLHSLAVCGLMIAVGRQFGIEGDELRNLGMAGLLHDVGMMQVPDWVLHKPKSLTKKEFNVIKTHPQLGWMAILKDAPDINEMVLDVCLHHHERIDGKGYPDALSGESLSLFTKICTVCDVYDTITSDRCYMKGCTPVEAIRKMAAWQPGQFDQKVFHAFVKTVGIYPAGTLIKLTSGRMGVVTDQTTNSLLTPKVKVFFSAKNDMPITPSLLDLSKSQDAIVSVEDPKKWGLNIKAITGYIN